MKKFISLESAVVAVLFVSLAFLFVRFNSVNNQKKNIHHEYKELYKHISRESSYEGKEINIREFYLYDGGGKTFNLNDFKNDYLLLFIVGKVNCIPCVTDFTDIFPMVSKKASIAGLIYEADEKGIQRFILKNNFDYPMYYSESEDWFKKNEMLLGPSVFLVSVKNRKIIKAFINFNRNGVVNKYMFIDFLKRYFNDEPQESI